MKVHQIIPGLYQRGDSRHLTRDVKLAALRTLNVRMVVNLAPQRDADLIDITGIDYRHFPQPDSHRFNWKDAHGLAYEAADTMCKGGAVLVQCHAGRNRSGAMSALIIRWLRAVPGREALQIVRAARPGAVATSAMEDYLVALA